MDTQNKLLNGGKDMATSSKLTYCAAYPCMERDGCVHINCQNENESQEKLVKGVTENSIKETSTNQNKEVLNLSTQGKLKMVKNHENLCVLTVDKDTYIHKAVAKQGYGLDKLVNDDSWVVRRAVAEQGYGLDKLINDNDLNVRKTVAEQGYGLDILINDEDENVQIVAEQIYESKQR